MRFARGTREGSRPHLRYLPPLVDGGKEAQRRRTAAEKAAREELDAELEMQRHLARARGVLAALVDAGAATHLVTPALAALDAAWRALWVTPLPPSDAQGEANATHALAKALADLHTLRGAAPHPPIELPVAIIYLDRLCHLVCRAQL